MTNTIDIFPSRHHALPDALTSLNAGPVKSPPLAPMDSVQSPAAGVAPSAIAAANQIISAISTTQAPFPVNSDPITFADVLSLIETITFPHDLITQITVMTVPPSQEEWNAIKKSITGLQFTRQPLHIMFSRMSIARGCERLWQQERGQKVERRILSSFCTPIQGRFSLEMQWFLHCLKMRRQ